MKNSFAHCIIATLCLIQAIPIIGMNNLIKISKISKTAQSGIHPYCVIRDKEDLEKIALQHIYQLVSLPLSLRRGQQHTIEERNAIIKDQIIAALGDQKVISKVYRQDDKTIGFINYSLEQSFFQRLFPKNIGSTATIHHLAVENTLRKSGYGTLLLENALQECKNNNVNKVILYTTGGSNLDDFYPRFGFEVVQRTKLNEQKWCKQLQPHPVMIIIQMMIQWIKNH